MQIQAAAHVLERALHESVAPAIAAEVGTSLGPTWQWAGGTLGRQDPTPADAATIFDLASLTKVIATATCALRLERAGRLAIDAPVAEFVPQWVARDRRSVTIRDLLEHCSGLPAHREYFRTCAGRAAFVAAIASEPLVYAPRTRAVYSDLGFILLGHVLEQLAGGTLDEEFDAWRHTVDDTDDIRYSPPQAWRSRTALTEYDTWRGRWLQGEVHDQNAAALGGVAPHAGLFGTAAAAGSAARWWLRQLAQPEGQRFARRSAVTGSSRALAWDTMLPTSSCGQHMPADAIGHTGFTGTSLWLAPSADRYFVLLTNRVHAGTSLQRIRDLRRAFHDAVNTSLP